MLRTLVQSRGANLGCCDRTVGTADVSDLAERRVPRLDLRVRAWDVPTARIRIRDAVVHHAVLGGLVCDVDTRDPVLLVGAVGPRQAATAIPGRERAVEASARPRGDSLSHRSGPSAKSAWLTIPQRGLTRASGCSAPWLHPTASRSRSLCEPAGRHRHQQRRVSGALRQQALVRTGSRRTPTTWPIRTRPHWRRFWMVGPDLRVAQAKGRRLGGAEAPARRGRALV